MPPDDMRFNIRTFVVDIKSRLDSSRENFEYLVDAYCWAQWPTNIKEINRVWPEYRQSWLQEQVRRIYNADPQQYSKIISRLGGGKTRAKRQRGWAFARRIGSWELYHADRVLTASQLSQLPDKFPSGKEQIPQDKIRSVVDEMAEILKSKQKAEDQPERIDYRREYFRLIQENAALKAEVRALAKENEFLRGKYEQLDLSITNLKAYSKSG